MTAPNDSLTVWADTWVPPMPMDTIVVFTGSTGDGGRVKFGVDHRPARELQQMIEDNGPTECSVEGWQVLRYEEGS